jgi:NADPH:quinone reductase-like Zn-dependent oxidoreductase
VRAVRFHEYGGPEVLKLEDIPEPEPGPDEVVVRVRAVGLNHVDIDMRDGTSRLPLTLPHTLGFEVGGDIAALGAEVDGWSVGDRVTPLYQVSCRACGACLAGQQQHCERIEMLGVTRPGGFAEYMVVPARSLAAMPKGMSYVQAASTQTTFGTAWHCLVTRAHVKPGDWVLVSAAGSGVGSAGIQVAKLAGARVITTSSSDEKLARALDLGADVTINYSTEDVLTRVHEATDGRGADIALEHVGGDVFGASLNSLAIDGRVVVCGGHAGEVVPVDLIELFRHEWSIIGCARASEAELRHVVELVGKGELEPAISETAPLEGAGELQGKMERREQFGKLVLEP